MGCNAAKNIAVEPYNGNLSNGHTEARTVPVSPKHQQILPPLEAEDLPEELLENSSVNNLQKGVNGMSFDIAFEEDSEDTNQKKIPPKRILERLEEPPPTPSLQQLQEKLEEAEIRRQQILAQRVQSAKLRNQMKKANSGNSNTDEEEEEEENGFLKVPTEPLTRQNNPHDVSYL